MGFSGLIAAGGQDALMEYLAQQRAQQQLQEMMRQAQEREAQSRAELDERRTAREADDDYRRGQVERQGRLDRQESNKTGVRQMIGGLVRREGITPDTQREILGLQAEAGEDIPLQLLMPPKPQEPERDPIADYEAKKKIDLKYREPSTSRAERDPIRDYELKKQIDAKYAQAGPRSPGSIYAEERAGRSVEMISDIEGRVNNWTAGLGGTVLSKIPATDATNLAADLDALASNIAFSELTEMRNASKTGGALGQVSNVELQLLEAALGSLRQSQSPGHLKQNLAKVRERLQRWDEIKNGAGIGSSQREQTKPAVSHGEPPKRKFTLIPGGE